MSLTLYRRHSRTCVVHGLGLSAAAARCYMDCRCPIWIYGRTETGKVPRQATGHNDLAAAEAIRKSLLSNGQDPVVHGPGIADCIERFIDSRRHELGDKTTGAYELLLGRLKDYCARRGVTHMKKLTVDLLEDFKVYGFPEIADTTRGNHVAKLRCFLRVAFRRGWITSALAQSVTPHSAAYEQKEPYSEDEVKLILEGALELDRGRNGYASVPETFRALLELMLETGMRVSDAVRFEPALLQKGEELWVYPYVQKKRKRTRQIQHTEAYLSERLKTAIDSCTWLTPTRPFWFGSTENQYRLGYQVYDTMQSIGSKVGVADCRPHRLRDTFAVRALLRGIPLEDVSRLLGHSDIKITQKYYAKWTPNRLRRLESLVAKSLVNA